MSISKVGQKGKPLLRFHEGQRLVAYLDSLGYWTVGVGHLLPDPENPKWKGFTITQKQCDEWFDEDIVKHQNLIDTKASWANDLDEVRAYVILDMTFNMGIAPFDGNGYKDWPNFVSQIRKGDWKAAASNMRATLWAKQVKGRAERLARMIETGRWPNEPNVPKIA
jgi:lysozyme